MKEKLKLVKTNQEKTNSVILHPDIVNILFEHRRYVKNIFLEIKGHYEIAYFGINIINPSNELVTFSSMPHIEYNMIQQKLWRHDPCFFSKTLNENTLYWWDNNFLENQYVEQIKEIKLVSNIFNAGMTICRKIDEFCFLYSYATASRKKDLEEYYSSNIFNLIDIGDYFCNSILDIYSEYCGNHPSPQLHQLNSKVSDLGMRSKLRLIINNS